MTTSPARPCGWPWTSASTSSTLRWPTATARASRCSANWRERHDRKLYVATKVPPKNRRWPSRPGDRLDDAFPPDYVRQCVETSRTNLGVDIDLLQFHVWEDNWAGDEHWQRVVDDLKREGVIQAIGISINRWQPANALRTLRTGLIDAVQVVYNIFDQRRRTNCFRFAAS